MLWNGDFGTLDSCNFVNNTANVEAGSVWWHGAKGSLSNCVFINNTANKYAGAVTWEGADGNIRGCTFVGNNATSAGAISVTSKTTNTTIIDSNFINNVAKDDSGAIS